MLKKVHTVSRTNLYSCPAFPIDNSWIPSVVNCHWVGFVQGLMALLSALCASMACQSIKLGNRQCWQSWAGSQLLNVDIMHISILARLVKIFSFVHIFQQLCWLHLKSDVYEFSATLFSSFGKTLLHTRFGKRVGVYLWCKCTCLWYSVFSAIIYFFFFGWSLFDCLIWDQCRSRQQTNWETWHTGVCVCMCICMRDSRLF